MDSTPFDSRAPSGNIFCNLAHVKYVNHVETNSLANTENQSGFQIMQIYVNFMHIFDNIRGF